MKQMCYGPELYKGYKHQQSNTLYMSKTIIREQIPDILLMWVLLGLEGEATGKTKALAKG